LTKQQLENEKSILELELENKNLAQIHYEQRLKLQKQESVEMALEIKRKRQWFNEIKDKLNTIRSPEDASQVIKDIIPNSIVDEKQELFKERVDELNKEYFENLLGKHPELTQIEKELCGLIKLNLNTKEIASTRGVTVNAIKVARRRLRKKLGITKDVDLYEYLQKI
jgi:DNA-binding CsgD family transcriptional regulator